MQLTVAANIAKSAGKQAIRDVMDARDRSNPWEISECWLKIAIVQALHVEARKPGSPLFRIHDEFLESEVINLPSEIEHPLDIAILYPVLPKHSPWEYTPAIGLIEIKKDFRVLHSDSKRLARLAGYPPHQELPLRWVLFVVFINGPDSNAVVRNEQLILSVVKQYGLAPLVPCLPENAPQRPASSTGDDSWFDVMCYGKEIL